MNFDLTDEQKDIIKAAREFAEKEFPHSAHECGGEGKSPAMAIAETAINISPGHTLKRPILPEGITK